MILKLGVEARQHYFLLRKDLLNVESDFFRTLPSLSCLTVFSFTNLGTQDTSEEVLSVSGSVYF